MAIVEVKSLKILLIDNTFTKNFNVVLGLQESVLVEELRRQFFQGFYLRKVDFQDIVRCSVTQMNITEFKVRYTGLLIDALTKELNILISLKVIVIL